jgi:hypothetical protein
MMFSLREGESLHLKAPLDVTRSTLARIGTIIDMVTQWRSLTTLLDLRDRRVTGVNTIDSFDRSITCDLPVRIATDDTLYRYFRISLQK